LDPLAGHSRESGNRVEGSISQQPSTRTPPHGPLRRFFGQVIGHVIPVLFKTHWPHIWQSKSAFLLNCFAQTKAPSTHPPGLNQGREIPGVHVVHLMAYREEHLVAEIIEEAGLLPVVCCRNGRSGI